MAVAVLSCCPLLGTCWPEWRGSRGWPVEQITKSRKVGGVEVGLSRGIGIIFYYYCNWLVMLSRNSRGN